MRTYPDMKITGRIMKGRETIGYTIVDTTGQTKKFKKDAVIGLAKLGKFINATAVEMKDCWMLKGTESCNLTKLPIIKVRVGE